MARVACDADGFTKNGRRLGRPRVDHSRLPCTGCGKPRDRKTSRCLACLAATKKALRDRDIEKARAYGREWAKRNPDKVRANASLNYQKNKERCKRQAREWGKKNPDKRSKIMIFQNAKRRSRKIANGGRGFNKFQWQDLLARCDGFCAYCRVRKANSIDHFIPLSKGGLHDFCNIVPACRMCNSTKRDNDPREWIVSTYGETALRYIERLLKSKLPGANNLDYDSQEIGSIR